MTSSKWIGVSWILVAALLVAGFIFGMPLLAKHVPWSLEQKIGKILKFGDDPCSTSAGNAALDKLVRRLYPIEPDDNFPVHVQVVSGDMVNAFASLGGEVYVYQGILSQAKSGDEMAGILAHEIEHIKQRHVVQGVIMQFFAALVLNAALGDASAGGALAKEITRMRFTKAEEDDADKGGLQRLAKAHISSAGLKRFFKALAENGEVPEILSDHPASEDRIARIDAIEVRDPVATLSDSEWTALRTICK